MIFQWWSKLFLMIIKSTNNINIKLSQSVTQSLSQSVTQIFLSPNRLKLSGILKGHVGNYQKNFRAPAITTEEPQNSHFANHNSFNEVAEK